MWTANRFSAPAPRGPFLFFCGRFLQRDLATFLTPFLAAYVTGLLSLESCLAQWTERRHTTFLWVHVTRAGTAAEAIRQNLEKVLPTGEEAIYQPFI